MEHYKCDSCQAQIPPQNPRFHCQACPTYESCANCYAIQYTRGNHQPSHGMELVRQSGLKRGAQQAENGTYQPAQFVVPVPGGQNLNYQQPTTPGPPPYQPTQFNAPIQGQQDLNYQQPPPTASYQPPQFQPPQFASPVQAQQYINYQQPTPVPPYQQQPAQPDATGYSNTWTPLYNSDNTPTPIFITVMEQLFACLDPNRTGHITPEAYSSFLEAQGYPPQMNIWRNAYNTAFTNKETIADQTLKAAYQTFSMEHILKMRQAPPPPPSRPQPRAGGFLSGLLANSMNSLLETALTTQPSPMPLLTLRGFFTGVSMDILVDPATGWAHLNRAMQFYRIPIWREKRDVPRGMVPLVTPPAVQAMVAQVQQGMKMNTEGAVQANRLRMEMNKMSTDSMVANAVGDGRRVYKERVKY